MKIKCIVKGCENHKHEGGFEDGMCLPCYLFITTGEGIYSQAYRNTHPVKELTDEECEAIINQHDWFSKSWKDMAKAIHDAILRKAS